MLSNTLTQRILQRFPSKLEYCFAYGSGVKKQTGYDDKAQKDAMIDLILCVDNAYEFHKENLRKNPRDYSLMRFIGPKLISEFQEYSAGVYCNTLIPIDKHTTIKYGVIRKQDLCDDLYHWNHLYVAGRLQKPVETLIAPTDTELKSEIEKNLENALHTALLKLPKEFTYYQLFHAIAEISYTGDFRMIFGEKKDKVKNIVEPQLDAFLKLYKKPLKKMTKNVHIPDLSKVCDTRIQQCKSYDTTLEHIEALPTYVKKLLLEMNGSLLNVANSNELPKKINTAIGVINWENSIGQSMKNIPTAGIFKSIKYATKKALKTFSK